MKTLTPCAVAIALTGCATVTTPLDEDYRFGDLTGSLLAAQAEYCATADPYRRAALAAVLRSQGIGLSPGGACTHLNVLVPELSQADIEQAEADRRLVRQRLEETTP